MANVGLTGDKFFEITSRDFLAGMTSSDYTEDGGFSPLSVGINLTYQPGILHCPPVMTDKSTNLVDNPIGYTSDASTAATADGFLLAADASSFDGTYYYWDGATLTLKRTDSTGNYSFGKSDITTYKGEVYATSDAYMIRWVPDTTFNATFFNFSSSVVPHPLLVYEDSLYAGDGNLLKRMTSAAGTVSTILTLPAGQTIVALGIDPGSGSMLISVINGINYSNTLNCIPRVAYYDGLSPKVQKIVFVDEMVTAFYNTGGIVYVGYGQNLGYWSGSGIQFLRTLGVTLDGAQLPYKFHFTNIGRTLYVGEGAKLLAYGEIIAGRGKVFYYPMQNSQSAAIFSLVTNIGSNKLGFGFATSQFWTWDSTAAPGPSNNFPFYSRKYEFPRPVSLQTVRILFVSNLPSTAGDIGRLQVIDDTNTTTTIATISNTAASGLLNDIEFPWPTLNSRSLQFIWKVDATRSEAIGVERITVFLTQAQ